MCFCFVFLLLLLFLFLHLFKLDQTFITAEGFTAVLQLDHETFVVADGVTHVAERQAQVVDFAVAHEAGVTAKSVDHAIQGHREFALRLERERVKSSYYKNILWTW